MNFFLSRSILVLLLISLCYGFSTSAQEITANFLKERLQQQLEKTPIEKVHLHLDKPYYMVGDDVWYKAYVLDDGNSIPSLISGILYLDLMDQKNTLVKTLKLPLLNGVTWGGFKLPNTLLEGRYTVVAYTQWMRNAGSAFFFKKDILVKNHNNNGTKPTALNKKDVDLQFFPEAGALIEDLPGKVAFKAVNKNGLGETVSGSIFDNDGVQVVDFESTYLGMGQLSITPQAGKTYNAKIKFKDNTEKIFPLPAVNPNGYQLTVNTNNLENFVARVLTSAALLGQQELTLLVHQNGKVYLETKIATEKQVVVIPLKTANLPSGVITLTLLSGKNLPICERVIFVNNTSRHLDVSVTGIANSYSPKGKLNLDLNVVLGKTPIQGSFSIATTNTSLVGVDADNETHILSSLLLQSDLMGHIEKPNAYFTDNAQQNNERIDYLMLTQGWRKILWNKIVDNTPFQTAFDVETQLKVSGTLLNAGKPSPFTKVSIISTPRILFSKDTVTDANGRFTFDKLNFKEGTKLVIKSLLPNNGRVKFVMDTTLTFVPQVTYHDNGVDTELAYQKVLDKYREVMRNAPINNEIGEAEGTMLKTVEIKGEVNKAPNSLNINGPGTADATFGVDDLKYATSLNRYIEGRVAGIVLSNDRFYLTRSSIGIAPGFGNPPQPMVIYLDGAKIDEGSTLEEFPVENIESVEILKSPAKAFVYGTNDGVILITTKTANSKEPTTYTSSQTNAGMITVGVQGFEILRKFYAPTYEVMPNSTSDVRPTVFWEPNLITDKDGKAKVSYFNAGIPGVYRMVIEGIDAAGNLARKVLTYEVK